MGRSRDAIQGLEPYLQEYGNKAYTDRKGTAKEKFGELVTSFFDLAGSMHNFQSKLFSILSAGAHPEPPGTSVERADAEFGLTVAMACRRYVGVRLLEPPVAEE
jgi:hypothetical protein